VAEVVVALDHSSPVEALRMVDLLGGEADFYKVGLELFTAAGPGLVRVLRERGKRVFLDLKLLDIPNTVAGAVRQAVALGVELLTVHLSGGEAMLRGAVAAAREGGDDSGERRRLRLLGVTLLTSLDREEVEGVWGRPVPSLQEEVLRLAALGERCGIHGVVASPLEAAALRRRFGPHLLLVTPGIRLPQGEWHDQTRVATPSAAAEAGADLLVVGRAVTGASDPAAALAAVRAGMASPAGGAR